jgi:hypothetical protein
MRIEQAYRRRWSGDCIAFGGLLIRLGFGRIGISPITRAGLRLTRSPVRFGAQSLVRVNPYWLIRYYVIAHTIFEIAIQNQSGENGEKKGLRNFDIVIFVPAMKCEPSKPSSRHVRARPNQ